MYIERYIYIYILNALLYGAVGHAQDHEPGVQPMGESCNHLITSIIYLNHANNKTVATRCLFV